MRQVGRYSACSGRHDLMIGERATTIDNGTGSVGTLSAEEKIMLGEGALMFGLKRRKRLKKVVNPSLAKLGMTK